MSETANKNLEIWNAVEATDPTYTKAFNRGGGFRGTATNATYLVKKATNQFGPIGIGWGWSVLEENYQPGQDKDVIHVLKIKLWYVWDGKRGEIEHFGQTQFVGKNKNGYYTDEEAPKKSLTDAVSKCLSLLGFAADVHLGLYDDNRYVNDLKRDFRDGDEFDGNNANDNERSDRQNDKSGLTTEQVDAILDTWEKAIAACDTVRKVMDLVGSEDFKADLKKLHPDDEEYLRKKANERSKALKADKDKGAKAA